MFSAIKEKYNTELPLHLLSSSSISEISNYIKNGISIKNFFGKFLIFNLDKNSLPELFESDCKSTLESFSDKKFDYKEISKKVLDAKTFSHFELSKKNSVFLTGATGFLGIYLLVGMKILRKILKITIKFRIIEIYISSSFLLNKSKR